MDDWFENSWYPSQDASTVVPENGPKWSGLYDSRGHKLYRPPNPVGFAPQTQKDTD